MVFKTLVSQVKLGVYAKTWGEVIGHVTASGWSEKHLANQNSSSGAKALPCGPLMARLKPCPSRTVGIDAPGPAYFLGKFGQSLTVAGFPVQQLDCMWQEVDH